MDGRKLSSLIEKPLSFITLGIIKKYFMLWKQSVNTVHNVINYLVMELLLLDLTPDFHVL